MIAAKLFLLAFLSKLGIMQFCARVAERQTRRSQKPLSKDVRVQIPPRAPVALKACHFVASFFNFTIRSLRLIGLCDKSLSAWNYLRRSKPLQKNQQQKRPHNSRSERKGISPVPRFCNDRKSHAYESRCVHQRDVFQCIQKQTAGEIKLNVS